MLLLSFSHVTFSVLGVPQTKWQWVHCIKESFSFISKPRRRKKLPGWTVIQAGEKRRFIVFFVVIAVHFSLEISVKRWWGDHLKKHEFCRFWQIKNTRIQIHRYRYCSINNLCFHLKYHLIIGLFPITFLWHLRPNKNRGWQQCHAIPLGRLECCWCTDPISGSVNYGHGAVSNKSRWNRSHLCSNMEDKHGGRERL